MIFCVWQIFPQNWLLAANKTFGDNDVLAQYLSYKTNTCLQKVKTFRYTLKIVLNRHWYVPLTDHNHKMKDAKWKKILWSELLKTFINLKNDKRLFGTFCFKFSHNFSICQTKFTLVWKTVFTTVTALACRTLDPFTCRRGKYVIPAIEIGMSTDDRIIWLVIV